LRHPCDPETAKPDASDHLTIPGAARADDGKIPEKGASARNDPHLRTVRHCSDTAP